MSERAYICGYKVPHYFFFMMSGMICDVIQFFVDKLIYSLYVIDFERSTVCWALSYMISIIFRHSSHRIFVFGEYEGTYFSSLMKTYLTYASSIVISIIANHILG